MIGVPKWATNEAMRAHPRATVISVTIGGEFLGVAMRIGSLGGPDTHATYDVPIIHPDDVLALRRCGPVAMLLSEQEESGGLTTIDLERRYVVSDRAVSGAVYTAEGGRTDVLREEETESAATGDWRRVHATAVIDVHRSGLAGLADHLWSWLSGRERRTAPHRLVVSVWTTHPGGMKIQLSSVTLVAEGEWAPHASELT